MKEVIVENGETQREKRGLEKISSVDQAEKDVMRKYLGTRVYLVVL